MLGAVILSLRVKYIGSAYCMARPCTGLCFAVWFRGLDAERKICVWSEWRHLLYDLQKRSNRKELDKNSRPGLIHDHAGAVMTITATSSTCPEIKPVPCACILILDGVLYGPMSIYNLSTWSIGVPFCPMIVAVAAATSAPQYIYPARSVALAYVKLTNWWVTRKLPRFPDSKLLFCLTLSEWNCAGANPQTL